MTKSPPQSVVAIALRPGWCISAPMPHHRNSAVAGCSRDSRVVASRILRARIVEV